LNPPRAEGTLSSAALAMQQKLILLVTLSVVVPAFAPVLGCAKPPAAAAPTLSVVEHGAQLYGKLCATCHGPAGNGYAADNSPSLRSPTFLASASDVFLHEGISRGRPGTAMAAFGRSLGGPLSPVDVSAVIAFLRAGTPPPLVMSPAPVTGDASRGKPLYDAICARCHGTPKQRSSAVHLSNPVFLDTASDAFLRWAIVNGRPPTSMVPWKDTFKPQQIDDLVVYLRSLAVPPGIPPAAQGMPPAAPRTGPVVLNPKGRPPEFTLKEDLYVSIDQVKAALDQKRRMVIGDARPPSDWLSLHVTGAISTPYYDGKSLDDIPNDGTWVLAYCACPHHVSGQVVAELRKRGYKHTAVIDEGIFAWQQKGYPVVTAPGLPTPAAPPPMHPVGAVGPIGPIGPIGATPPTHPIAAPPFAHPSALPPLAHPSAVPHP
jgi:cytochrome c oxidase cbb3-type subunit III